MKRIWLLASANLRKSKSYSISLLIMIMLSSAFLNIGLLTIRNYEKAFDERAQELNTSDVMSLVQKNEALDMMAYEAALHTDENTKAVESRDILLLNGSCSYNEGTTNRLIAVLNKDDETIMNRYEMIEQASDPKVHGVYLPYLFKVGGGYEIGDDFLFQVAAGSGEDYAFHYTVAGFFDEIMLGTINSSSTGIVLDAQDYDALSADLQGAMNAKMFLVQLYDASAQEVFATKHTPATQNVLYDINFYDTLKMSRTITSSIGSMLIIAFSIILSIIALVVIRYHIVNFIDQEMKNIGTLKAIGYTGRQIINSIHIQFLTIALLGISLGLCISYLALPIVVQMFAQQTGMLWQQGIDITAGILTCIILIAAVYLVVEISAHKAKTLHPITALRSGILTHSFKKNYIPLATSHGSVISLMAGKLLVQNMKRNILVGFIVVCITFASAFCVILYDNIVLHFDTFLETTVGEVIGLQISTYHEQQAQQLKEELAQRDDIRKVLFFQNYQVKSADGAVIYLYSTHDFNDFDYQKMIYEGRFPRYDNEIAIGGLLASTIEKAVGDTIIIENGDESYTYLITGLIQGSNYMGHDGAMTKEGCEHIIDDYQDTVLSVYVQEDIDGDQTLDEISEEYHSDIAAIRNVRKSMEASMMTYRSIVSILMMVIMLITFAMIALILYLVVKTSLMRQKRELGIQKAIGFTTTQLIIQNTVSFMPMLLCSSILGGMLAAVCTNPILSMLFSGIGMMKVAFQIKAYLLFIVILTISSFGCWIIMAVSMRIRNIYPHELISE